ncbi:hypothetical protein C8R45DRAFT_940867 [Mycena sanguinolenta]|nr:hypothetical protein C8R45DRAFT_940867 [Mycena sanguinolenta]
MEVDLRAEIFDRFPSGVGAKNFLPMTHDLASMHYQTFFTGYMHFGVFYQGAVKELCQFSHNFQIMQLMHVSWDTQAIFDPQAMGNWNPQWIHIVPIGYSGTKNENEEKKPYLPASRLANLRILFDPASAWLTEPAQMICLYPRIRLKSLKQQRALNERTNVPIHTSTDLKVSKKPAPRRNTQIFTHRKPGWEHAAQSHGRTVWRCGRRPEPREDGLEVRTRGQSDEECDDDGEISTTRTSTLKEREQSGRDSKTKIGRTSIANCGWELRRWTLKEMKRTKPQAWTSKPSGRDTEPNENLLRERF